MFKINATLKSKIRKEKEFDL